MKKNKRVNLLVFLLIGASLLSIASLIKAHTQNTLEVEQPLNAVNNTTTPTTPTPDKSPVSPLLDPTDFRGFNLLSTLLVGDWVDNDTEEWAFKFMADEGFNFARIPMEVQKLYTDPDYTLWNSAALEEIDKIIALGQKYDIHILLDLHTLPGIRPGGIEPSDAAFDATQRLAIWKDIFYVLSRRYQQIPRDDLSYNLINEPYQIETDVYMENILEVLSIIREVDTEKLIFIDPNNWTGEALYELATLEDPHIVASPHFYQPFLVTHYLAEWVEGAESFPIPEYPSLNFNGTLYGNYHPEWHQPMLLKGLFRAGTKVTLRIHHISDFVDLSVTTEKETLGRQSFQTNDDASFWKEVTYNEEWKIYQNVYDQDFSVTLTQDTAEIRLALVSGDWLDLSSITIEQPHWTAPLKIQARNFEWGNPKSDIFITPSGTIDFHLTQNVINREFLYEDAIKQWKRFSEETNIPVVACEFGVYNKTSHAIALRVLEDHLSLFNENNFGFALWNLSGAFGIFNSGRPDVTYELHEGNYLDRHMLELLKKY